MKALVGAFNQEKALVGAFSVIVQPVVEPMDRFAALLTIAAEECDIKLGTTAVTCDILYGAGPRNVGYEMLITWKSSS